MPLQKNKILKIQQTRQPTYHNNQHICLLQKNSKFQNTKYIKPSSPPYNNNNHQMPLHIINTPAPIVKLLKSTVSPSIKSNSTFYEIKFHLPSNQIPHSIKSNCTFHQIKFHFPSNQILHCLKSNSTFHQIKLHLPISIKSNPTFYEIELHLQSN